jgi:hypothetical protein
LAEALSLFPLSNDAGGAALMPAAAAGIEMHRLLASAQRRAGREVIDAVFQLHAILRGEAPPAGHPLSAHAPWLAALCRTDEQWRRVFIQWIEVLGERLTQARYTTAPHRHRQARVLLAAPVVAALRLSEIDAVAIDAFAGRALRLWDLIQTDQAADVGWNRIEIAGDDAMGGFHGLGERCLPASPESIQTFAGRLAAELRDAPIRPAHPGVAQWIAGMESRMAEVLVAYAQSNQWPAGITRTRKQSWWARLFRRG